MTDRKRTRAGWSACGASGRAALVLAVMVGLTMAASVPARAQPGGQAEDQSEQTTGDNEMVGMLGERDRPWAKGVSFEDQQAARLLFEEANVLLKDSLFAQAAAKYREALARWDHPGIHYNLALALMSLEQPIEVYEALTQATRYGDAPLDAEKLERAQSYLTLLEQQLVRVVIRCEDGGARVTLDGKLLFTGPGKHESMMRAGEHSIIAQKPGHLTDTRQLVFTPGEPVDIDIDLLTVDEATYTQRRWSAWKPWAVTGAGLVVSAASGYLHWRSLSNFDSYDTEFAMRCANGCEDEQVPDLNEMRDRASLQRRIAIVSSAVGGTALVTGLVLLYLNRGKVVRKDLAEDPAHVTIVPLLAPDTGGVSATIRF